MAEAEALGFIVKVAGTDATNLGGADASALQHAQDPFQGKPCPLLELGGLLAAEEAALPERGGRNQLPKALPSRFEYRGIVFLADRKANLLSPKLDQVGTPTRKVDWARRPSRHGNARTLQPQICEARTEWYHNRTNKCKPNCTIKAGSADQAAAASRELQNQRRKKEQELLAVGRSHTL